ncbi:hypothetical protein EV122DRAFT_251188 [Schizophyllum commune]
MQALTFICRISIAFRFTSLISPLTSLLGWSRSSSHVAAAMSRPRERPDRLPHTPRLQNASADLESAAGAAGASIESRNMPYATPSTKRSSPASSAARRPQATGDMDRVDGNAELACTPRRRRSSFPPTTMFADAVTVPTDSLTHRPAGVAPDPHAPLRSGNPRHCLDSNPPEACAGSLGESCDEGKDPSCPSPNIDPLNRFFFFTRFMSSVRPRTTVGALEGVTAGTDAIFRFTKPTAAYPPPLLMVNAKGGPPSPLLVAKCVAPPNRRRPTRAPSRAMGRVGYPPPTRRKFRLESSWRISWPPNRRRPARAPSANETERSANSVTFKPPEVCVALPREGGGVCPPPSRRGFAPNE